MMNWELNEQKFCDIEMSEAVMGLMIDESQKPSVIAESAVKAALALVMNIDNKERVLAFCDLVDGMVERLRGIATDAS